MPGKLYKNFTIDIMIYSGDVEFNVKDNIVSDIKILNSDIQSDTMKKEVWNIEIN